MSEETYCTSCGAAISGRKTLVEYKGKPLWLCAECASLPMPERQRRLKPAMQTIDRAEREAAEQAIQYRSDITEEQIESLILHAFIDLIQERKAAGKIELAATMETIATWLSDRTTLPVTAYHVQLLTHAMRDGLLIAVGGGGIGRPNTYDTREKAMGIGAFWDQVDAFLTVWRIPNKKSMLRIS